MAIKRKRYALSNHFADICSCCGFTYFWKENIQENFPTKTHFSESQSKHVRFDEQNLVNLMEKMSENPGKLDKLERIANSFHVGTLLCK